MTAKKKSTSLTTRDAVRTGERACVIPDILEPEAPQDGTGRGIRQERRAPSARTVEDAVTVSAEAVVDDVDFAGDRFDEGAALDGDDMYEGAEDTRAGTVEVAEDSDYAATSLPARREDVGNLPAVRRTHLPSPRESLSLYQREVSRFPLLQPDEERELAERFRDTRDPDAAFRLVSSHLRLVVRIALDFQRRWMQNVLDLVQEGNVGLMHALYKFDPDKGIKFSYYAQFWIKAYILKFIMDNFRMVKIGTTQVQRKLFFNLNKERQKLIAQGFDPDADMLSKSLGVSVEDIREMDQRLSAGDVSLNTPVSDEENSASRLDFLPALGPGVEDSIAGSEIASLLREKLSTLMPSLSDKETYILKNRLLSDSPLTLREIGEKFHVTRERVRQLEIRLLEKIRKHVAMDIQDFSEEWIASD